MELEHDDQHVSPILESPPLVIFVPFQWGPQQERQDEEEDPRKNKQQREEKAKPLGIQQQETFERRVVHVPEGNDRAEKPALGLQAVLCLRGEPRLKQEHLDDDGGEGEGAKKVVRAERRDQRNCKSKDVKRVDSSQSLPHKLQRIEIVGPRPPRYPPECQNVAGQEEEPGDPRVSPLQQVWMRGGGGEAGEVCTNDMQRCDETSSADRLQPLAPFSSTRSCSCFCPWR
mmetsp:Transcript_42021/g.132438  ORF Transcript_42021/g.132438 Transcript_42021/m.132438 type:complete len:229 (-) Transcript_42021:547-1233(-)